MTGMGRPASERRAGRAAASPAMAQTPADQRPARFLRLEKAVSIPRQGARQALNFDRQTAFGAAGNYMREILGYVPIEPDGSVRVTVPANMAFQVSVVDATDRGVACLPAASHLAAAASRGDARAAMAVICHPRSRHRSPEAASTPTAAPGCSPPPGPVRPRPVHSPARWARTPPVSMPMAAARPWPRRWSDGIAVTGERGQRRGHAERQRRLQRSLVRRRRRQRAAVAVVRRSDFHHATADRADLRPAVGLDCELPRRDQLPDRTFSRCGTRIRGANTCVACHNATTAATGYLNLADGASPNNANQDNAYQQLLNPFSVTTTNPTTGATVTTVVRSQEFISGDALDSHFFQVFMQRRHAYRLAISR